MTDLEVRRLRRLRARALRVRAVAQMLGTEERSDKCVERLMQHGGCAAWRVARAVSGRLRSHPYARFQRGASVTTVLMNGLAAKAADWSAATPAQRLRQFERHLRLLSRELDDARALTHDPELSDMLGRSQQEMSDLNELLETQTHSPIGRLLPDTPRPLLRRSTARESDWPYLAF